MSIEDDYSYSTPAKRSGPKAFSEYTFNALMVMLGLVGSLLTTLGGASYYFVFLLPLFIPPIFGTLMISSMVGMLTIPFGIAQIYYAWKLHTENFQEFSRILVISWILIVLAVLSAIFAGFLFILIFQLVGSQVLLNILVIFFLSKTEVQQEFMWEQGGF
ncbi:MAG: hypothetical protein ACXAB0_08190 [Candidatus Thorarchaeota archaeon]